MVGRASEFVANLRLASQTAAGISAKDLSILLWKSRCRYCLGVCDIISILEDTDEVKPWCSTFPEEN